MAATKYASPTLNLRIDAEQWLQAREADSGGCLIADAIKRQYPNLKGVSVDMATIRATDPKKGLRYTYLTPNDAQYLLLAFDQGWSQPDEHALTIKRAVRVTRIVQHEAAAARRRERIAELEAKKDAGTITSDEKRALSQMSKRAPRATKRGKTEATRDGRVVTGGKPPVQGPAHPNLLRGRNRHYGAKQAAPAQAWSAAVAEAAGEIAAGRATLADYGIE